MMGANAQAAGGQILPDMTRGQRHERVRLEMAGRILIVSGVLVR